MKPEMITELIKRIDGAPALLDVIAERALQDAKWGKQDHDPFAWIAILMEEVGEYSKEALETRFGGEANRARAMRGECVQVAAVALAMVECLDRDEWCWPMQKIKVPPSICRCIIDRLPDGTPVRRLADPDCPVDHAVNGGGS